MIDTKTRILDAAERLIAEHGLDVSLRTITAAADVNLAAVNYHFQSKDALTDAVIARRLGPVNARRLEMLEALEREHPEGALPLDDVLRAFIEPVLEMAAGTHIPVLIGRLFSTPDEFMSRVFQKHLAHIAERFGAAFERAVPEVSAADRTWCMFLTIGAMVHLMAWSRKLPLISRGALPLPDAKTAAEQLVRFASAGFRAALENSVRQQEGARHA